MYAFNRNSSDRRSGNDRRKIINLHWFSYKGPDRRTKQDRRSKEERRNDWVRINKWSSVHLPALKIAKYLNLQ